jgi:hypothetical protein
VPWSPGDPWPSDTPGGASSPHWGDYVRLWVRAALAAGDIFRLGASAHDRLDDGNVLAGALTPEPPNPYLSTDTFNRADSSSGMGSTDGTGTKDPAAWNLTAPGCYGIQTNRAYPVLNAQNVAWIDLAAADVDLSVTAAAFGAAGVLIAFRFADLSNYLYAVAYSGGVLLIRRQAASNTVLAGPIAGFTAGETLRVVAVGSSITVYRNAAVVATVTETFNATVTKHGVGFGGTTGNPRADNWSAMVPGAMTRRPRTTDDAGRLWADLSCDTLDVDIQGGASSSDGILTKPDATTCVVNLADPARKYDPLNGSSPYAIGGTSRLVPGTPVEVFAEVVNADDGTYATEWLFTGTADSWGEDWTPNPRRRVAQLIASGETKTFVNMKRPATVPAVGAGDTTAQRVQRIVDLAGWLGDVEAGAGTVTHAATELDNDGWELLNGTLDDELGFIYFTAAGALRWVGRAAWFDLTSPPVLELGCGEGLHDVLVDASPTSIDLQIRNSIFAARPDVTPAHALSVASINRYGRFDYARTDLGVATDAQAADWAATLLRLYAYPQISIADVTMQPAIAAASWQVFAGVLGLSLVTDLLRIVWSPPDRPADTPIDALARVVGFHHVITRRLWEITLELVGAEALAYSGAVFTLGPDANDRLDAAYVLGG